MNSKEVDILYVGHSTFILDDKKGTRMLIDPWLKNNPACPDNLQNPKDIDYILIMSVFPGFGGQSFIEGTLKKMELLKDMVKERNILLSVDGGVNLNTINKIYKTGVDITVVGSALYGADNVESRYKQLMNA